MTAALVHEVGQLRARVEQLEAELQCKREIISDQADTIARIGLPYHEQRAVLFAIRRAIIDSPAANVTVLRAAQARLT